MDTGCLCKQFKERSCCQRLARASTIRTLTAASTQNFNSGETRWQSLARCRFLPCLTTVTTTLHWTVRAPILPETGMSFVLKAIKQKIHLCSQRRLLSQRQRLIAQRLEDLISLPDAAVRDWLILAGSVLEHGSQLQCRVSCI